MAEPEDESQRQSAPPLPNGEQRVFVCPAPRVIGEKVVKRIEPPLPEDDDAET